MVVGARVEHSKHGLGVVQHIFGAELEPKHVKVKVAFDSGQTHEFKGAPTPNPTPSSSPNPNPNSNPNPNPNPTLTSTLTLTLFLTLSLTRGRPREGTGRRRATRD